MRLGVGKGDGTFVGADVELPIVVVGFEVLLAVGLGVGVCNEGLTVVGKALGNGDGCFNAEGLELGCDVGKGDGSCVGKLEGFDKEEGVVENGDSSLVGGGVEPPIVVVGFEVLLAVGLGVGNGDGCFNAEGLELGCEVGMPPLKG